MKNLKRVKGIAIIAVLVLAVLITGCDEGLNMAGDIISEPAEVDPGVGDVSPEPTVPDEEPNPVVVMGGVKDPDPEPPVIADPEADPESATDEPVDTEPPTVSEVGFYRDWQLMEEVAAMDVMRPGDTIYIKVVFSEPMQHIADAGTRARPALSLVLDSQEARFQVAEHGASGEQFTSGVCKPLHGGVDDYLCKVTIPVDTVGTVALRVEVGTADASGNPVAEATIHPSSFVVEPKQPVVSEVVSEPEPTPPTSVGPGEYTFTIEGETYPGFSPSPGLQHVLDTHPSAKLPHFLEAVKMVEMVDWVFRKSYEVYGPEDKKRRWAETDAALEQFGLSGDLGAVLKHAYYSITGEPDGGSRYWVFVEYLRLQEENPSADEWEMTNLFDRSVRKGFVVGTTNPNIQ